MPKVPMIVLDVTSDVELAGDAESALIYVKGFAVYICKTDSGVLVDLYAKGYELRGGSGNWEATHGCCHGVGRTKELAIAACRKEQRVEKEENEVSDREESEMLRDQGYREAGPEECESDGTVLWTAGKSWVVKEVSDE